MNIMVCSSKGFFPYLTVMLESLYENNQDSTITVYVLHSELEDSDMLELEKQAGKFNHRIHAISISDEQISALPTRQQWPAVLYYRLMLVDVLPKTIDKILSLDIDIIVQKSLQSLYDIDMASYYIAACADAIDTPRYKSRLNMSLDDTYHNAGIVLFNLKQMRADSIGILTFLQTSQDQGNQLAIPDQDLLNLVLSSNSITLEASCYNCTPEMYEQLYGSPKSQSKEFASIVHYLRSDCKPWNTYVAKPDSELEQLWWSYARKSIVAEQLQAEFQKKVASSLVKENLALKTYYGIALQWLQVENRQTKLESYLLGRNIHKVAVYGLNTFQEILCRDLEESQVEIAYLIDSYAKGYAYGYEVKNGSHFDDVDAIIVAASAHFREIRAKLDDECPVLSLNELISSIYRM